MSHKRINISTVKRAGMMREQEGAVLTITDSKKKKKPLSIWKLESSVPHTSDSKP